MSWTSSPLTSILPPLPIILIKMIGLDNTFSRMVNALVEPQGYPALYAKDAVIFELVDEAKLH